MEGTQTKSIGHYSNKGFLKERRKELRRDATFAERLLWVKLKGKQFGVKFRRQYNIDYYIVDFYCHELKLIIELDGWVHGEAEQQRKDQIRQRYLEQKGYTVIRYKNEELKNDLDGVLQDIWNRVQRIKQLQ